MVQGSDKEKMINVDFEPFKPVTKSVYICNSRFFTEPLEDMLESHEKFGFIIMDGNGALFGTLCGSVKVVLHRFGVDLPNKHSSGGQSAKRFAHQRLEKREAYVKKVRELAVQFFISNDVPNVSGLIFAGCADFKSKLATSKHLDPRIRDIVIKTLDISYGGEKGFQQAITMSADELSGVRFLREKKLIAEYFRQVSCDSGKYCFGVRDTMYACESGAAETLILWEDLKLTRFELMHPISKQRHTVYLDEKQSQNSNFFVCPTTHVSYDVVAEDEVVEWFTENYRNFGCTLEIISSSSEEGSQFCRGFGGIGAILRYEVNFHALESSLEASAISGGGDDAEDDDTHSDLDEYADLF